MTKTQNNQKYIKEPDEPDIEKAGNKTLEKTLSKNNTK